MRSRRRYQQGSLKKVEGRWIAQWWEDGHRRKRTLGKASDMTKAQAKAELAAILAPINAKQATPSPNSTFHDFAVQVYLPFYRRKWKRSTIITNEDRISNHLTSEFAGRTLGGFGREELQTFLDRKAAEGLSYSIVAHLRWDLRAIFRMAVAEGYRDRNPAELLFVPRGCPRPETRIMTLDQAKTLLSALELREKVIVALAVIAGLRPGEIFGLQWGRLDSGYADIRQRVYKGDVDSPKSVHSVRWAALSDGLQRWIRQWREMAPDPTPDAWVFPSEKLNTPLLKENWWRRNVAPVLKALELEWVNFHVMRRTHSCLMKELDVDPQVRAEQMGHTVDVNENVYTKTSLDRRRQAVNALESALRVM